MSRILSPLYVLRGIQNAPCCSVQFLVQFALRETICRQSGTQFEDFERNEMEKSGGNREGREREREKREDMAGILFIWFSFRLI